MEPNSPVIGIINALTDKGCSPKKQGKEFKAKCPAHADKSASLQVGEGDKGAVLHCHAGCEVKTIMEKLGLPMTALFADDKAKAPASAETSRGIPSGCDAAYYYEDENGKVLYRVERRPDKKFMQARPDHHQPGNWLYTMGDVERVPYRLPNVKGAVKDGEWIWIVEGEKDVHTLESHGLVATCNVGGAGKFRREYADYFAGGKVCIVPDNDEPGEAHGRQVADLLKDSVRSVTILRLPNLPEKGDVTDWLAAGNDVDEMKLMAEALTPVYSNKPAIFDADWLMKETFEDVVMAVPGIIAEGATFLVGAPKIGKSWMSLGLGLAVARGDMALGTIPVEQGPVLYLAMEDTPRRLQRRLSVMLGVGVEAPSDLHFACQWPRLNNGGLDRLEEWLKDHPTARMVIIDTWAKVKAPMGTSNASMYEADYSAVSAVKTLADIYGTAIVMIHHTRKQTDGDPLNTVAGSTGLTGAADATVILTRNRSTQEGTLYVTGRDVEESKSLVRFEAETGNWVWMGAADDIEEKRIETQIIELLADTEDCMGPKEIAAAFDMKEGTAKWMMAKLATEGKITRKSRGKYTVEGDQIPEMSGGVALVPGANGAAQFAPGSMPGGVLRSAVQPPIAGLPGKTVALGPNGTVLVDEDDDDDEYGEDDEPDPVIDGIDTDVTDDEPEAADAEEAE